MRHLYHIILFASIISCRPFHQDRVLRKSDNLKAVTDYLITREIDKIISSDKSEITRKMVWSGMDAAYNTAIYNGDYFNGFVEGSDSLIIMIKSRLNIFSLEKRIIYDFAKTPRMFGSNKISGAEYEITQLNDR